MDSPGLSEGLAGRNQGVRDETAREGAQRPAGAVRLRSRWIREWGNRGPGPQTVEARPRRTWPMLGVPAASLSRRDSLRDCRWRPWATSVCAPGVLSRVVGRIVGAPEESDVMGRPSTTYSTYRLYLQVRTRLEQRTLPRAPSCIRASRAVVRRHCVVCGRGIRPGAIQNEVVMGDDTKAWAHTICLGVWIDVTREMKAGAGQPGAHSPGIRRAMAGEAP